MARLRAVVVIQPPGLGGIPLCGGHCSAAITNASATASCRQVDVAQDADQGGGAAARFAPEDLVDSVGHP